jgi:predicted dehydrogenase
MHLEIAVAAAQAGKHIFCEKPVGRSPEETQQIEAAARRAGVLSFVGFNYRWAPLVQYAKQLIDEGRLGKLTHYRGRFFSMYGSDPYSMRSWRFDSQLAGLGTLGDLMPHVIDMAHMLAGPMRRVVSSRNTYIKERPVPTPGQGTHFSRGAPGDPTEPVTNEDYVGALVEFRNGVYGTLEACRVIYGPKCEMAFEINGTEGAIRWNVERMNELELYLPGEEGIHNGYTRILGGPEYGDHSHFNPGDGIGIGYEDTKTIEAYNFLASIVEGKQRAPGFAEALKLANVQSALQQSWSNGAWEAVFRG